MKAFVSALVVAGVIGTGAWAVLSFGLDYSSARVYAPKNPEAVRLSPGDGLRKED
jgi:hypothetical protein